MSTILRYWIIGISILGASIAMASQPILSKAGLEAYVLKKRGWTKAELVYERLDLSPDRSREYSSVTSEWDCGQGVCTSYLFERTPRGSWRLIGEIHGRIEVTASVVNGHFVIAARSRVGGLKSDVLMQTYAYDGKSYALRQ